MENLTNKFLALGEPRRLQILELLAQRGTLNSTQICDALELSPSLMSHHLEVLEKAELVTRKRDGLFRLTTLNRAYLEDAISELQQKLRLVHGVT